MILDADGLNAFAPLCEPFKNENGQPIALTPHPGEMARLAGKTIAEVQQRRVETALGVAERYGAWVTLKGSQTLTAAPDGELFINTTGNPGMATGGSGDILAGMMGRFVAAWKLNDSENRPGFSEYLASAVYLHGMAGDIAAGKGSRRPPGGFRISDFGFRISDYNVVGARFIAPTVENHLRGNFRSEGVKLLGSEESLMATDLLEYLPQAFRETLGF